MTIGEGCKNGSLSSSGNGLTETGFPPGGTIGPGGIDGTGGTDGPGGIDGTGNNIAKDSFQVHQPLTDPKVDILVVIDTSGSMHHHQQKLGERFNDLILGLSDSDLHIDWQIAFINVDDSEPRIDANGYHGTFYNLENEDGELLIDEETVNILNSELLEYLDDSDNLQEIFYNTIDRSGKSVRMLDGKDADSRIEAPLRNIKNAISKRNNENSGFFRDSATLVTIILSNEDEFSDGQPKKKMDPPNPTTPSEVTQAVSDAFGSDKKFLSYGIIIIPGDTECLDTERRVGYKKSNYSTFIFELSTKTYSICEESYSGILQDIASHLEATLTLSHIPFRFSNVIEDSITLTFTPSENAQTGTFDASSNTYIFDEKIANGTTILVEYEYRQ